MDMFMKVNDISDFDWYFAYGSNLCLQQMRMRTDFQGKYFTCKLSDYKLVFNKRSFRTPGKSFANIIPCPGLEVWGVAYSCSIELIDRLDAHEYVAQKNYVHHGIRVLSKSGESFRALTYVAGSDFICTKSSPAVDYVKLMINSARFHNLPENYIFLLQKDLEKLELNHD